MKYSPIERAVRDFLVEELSSGSGRDLGPDDSLLELGLLDSMAVIKIVAFCEANFGISIPDEDVLPQHFESVRAIAKLIERRKARVEST